MLLTPGQKVDRYVVRQPLGRGGMSRVYLAEHAALGSLHALKVLERPSRQGRKRLQREGQIMSRLQHQNLARVTDLVEVEGHPVLVVEYVADGTLDQLLMGRPVPLELASDIALQLMDGIEAAHQAGVVHRDLKPGNVLLLRSGERWIPKVADFGIARVFADRLERLTPMGAPMGTRGYSAPEQFLNARDVDERADVFSLGAVLYELLGGQRAFTMQDLMQGAWEGRPAARRLDLLSLRPSLTEAIAIAVEGALVLDRAERIPDIATFRRVWTGQQVWEVPGRVRAADDWAEGPPARMVGLHPEPPAFIARPPEPVRAEVRDLGSFPDTATVIEDS